MMNLMSDSMSVVCPSASDFGLPDEYSTLRAAYIRRCLMTGVELCLLPDEIERFPYDTGHGCVDCDYTLMYRAGLDHPYVLWARNRFKPVACFSSFQEAVLRITVMGVCPPEWERGLRLSGYGMEFDVIWKIPV